MYTLRLSNSCAGAVQSVYSVIMGWTGRFQTRTEIVAGPILEPRHPPNQLIVEARSSSKIIQIKAVKYNRMHIIEQVLNILRKIT
jgi:hypothetical protein